MHRNLPSQHTNGSVERNLQTYRRLSVSRRLDAHLDHNTALEHGQKRIHKHPHPTTRSSMQSLSTARRTRSRIDSSEISDRLLAKKWT